MPKIASKSRFPQPIQPISTQIGLNWLCSLAGNSQTSPTIFFIFSAYVLSTIKWRSEHTNHFCANIFDTYYCQDRWCDPPGYLAQHHLFFIEGVSLRQGRSFSRKKFCLGFTIHAEGHQFYWDRRTILLIIYYKFDYLQVGKIFLQHMVWLHGIMTKLLLTSHFNLPLRLSRIYLPIITKPWLKPSR